MKPPDRRKCAKCNRNRAERFFTSERGTVCTTCQRKTRSTTGHESRMKAVYGLDKGEYDKLLAYQKGVCAICGGTRRQRLSVDHCHTQHAVRGLICRRCNGQLLPAAMNNPEILRKAAEYLENWPADQVFGRRRMPE